MLRFVTTTIQIDWKKNIENYPKSFGLLAETIVISIAISVHLNTFFSLLLMCSTIVVYVWMSLIIVGLFNRFIERNELHNEEASIAIHRHWLLKINVIIHPIVEHSHVNQAHSMLTVLIVRFCLSWHWKRLY